MTFQDIALYDELYTNSDQSEKFRIDQEYWRYLSIHPQEAEKIIRDN
jgi:hypothetical protein